MARICGQCASRFPNRITIRGRRVNIHRRVFCPLCSPFGLHNTRPLVARGKSIGKVVNCEECGKTYTYLKLRGHQLRKCITCLSRARRRRLRIKMIQYKGGKCVICGYNKCISALEFHHIDPKIKEFTLSGIGLNNSLKRIQAELDKCILVCSNHHKEIAQGLYPEYNNIEARAVAQTIDLGDIRIA